jgi:hypothetical protein
MLDAAGGALQAGVGIGGELDEKRSGVREQRLRGHRRRVRIASAQAPGAVPAHGASIVRQNPPSNPDGTRKFLRKFIGLSTSMTRRL